MLVQQTGSDKQYSADAFWQRAAGADGRPANSTEPDESAGRVAKDADSTGSPASADSWNAAGGDWQSSVELDGGVPETGREALLAYVGIFVRVILSA